MGDMDFDRFTITLLVRRADAPELTPEQQKTLQNAHMAHIAALHEAGQVLVAGPLLDPDSELRGLSILNVGVEEALRLANSDPAVQAGVYTIVALPWMAPAGTMSFAPARFPRTSAEAAEG
jgi:uncharacterized protein